MKTQEELNAIKGEIVKLKKVLCELTDEELEQVISGVVRSPKYVIRLLKMYASVLGIKRG